MEFQHHCDGDKFVGLKKTVSDCGNRNCFCPALLRGDIWTQKLQRIERRLVLQVSTTSSCDSCLSLEAEIKIKRKRRKRKGAAEKKQVTKHVNNRRFRILSGTLRNHVQCTIYNVQCSMYNAQCLMYLCTMIICTWTLYI